MIGRKLLALALLGFSACSINTREFMLPTNGMADWSQGEDKGVFLGESCGVLYQATLRRTTSANFVMYFIRNTSPADVKLNPAETNLAFDGGTSRLPLDAASDVSVPADKKWNIVLMFPDKDDFANQTGLTTELPVVDANGKTTCKLTARFTHDPASPDDEESISDRTDGGMDFNLGGVLKQGGATAAAGDSGALIDITFFGYSGHNGSYVDVLISPRNAASGLAAPAGNTESPLMVTDLLLATGYTYRAYLSRRWTINFDLGVGAECSSIGNGNPGASTWGLGLEQRIGINYGFPHHTLSQYGLNLMLVNWLVSGGQTEGQSFAGDHLGIMFGIRLGI